MVVKELILKVSNICNLDCQYCYVFNKGDNTYRNGPRIMDVEVADLVIEKISEHCKMHSLTDFVVIFHGGEPLLAGEAFFRTFVEKMKNTIDGVNFGFGLQTNGTLLTKKWISLFRELNISVGISLDGTRKASKYRIYKQTKKESYDDIISALKLLHENDYPVNILSVINIDEKPDEIYTHLKENNISSVEFLFPDTTYDQCKCEDGLISEWLINIFDLWYNDVDSDKPTVRLFDMIIGMVLGVERGNETLGRKVNQCLCIKPNGDIQAIDNLMVCGNGFTKLDLHLNNNNFDDALKTDLMKKYYFAHQDEILCEKCKNCIIKNICGGGHLAHRYSSSNGFCNPSVYCKDICMLVAYIQNKISEDLFNELEDGLLVEKLQVEDFC